MKRLPGSPRFPGLPALLALLLLASCNWQRPQPGFTLALNPTSLTVQQGSNGQTTLTVTPQNGFTGTVSLSLVAGQDQVPQGLTLSPGSVQVSGSGPVNQPLTLSAQPTTPTGTYRLKVRATSGSLTREADLTVAVTAPPPSPGFTLALNPTSLTVQQGASGQTTLTVTPQNGFTGTVSLSLVAGQDQVPQGLTLSPGSVQVSGSGPVNQPLTLSAQPTAPTGTYRLKVRATSGNLTREADLTVTVSASGGGGGGGGGAGEVSLPPPVSGQGFPQPPLEVGLPEQGASLLAQDRLERVLITPQTMTLTPGEERFLSVWVETESGQRYAGDERYLELKWAGPQGYQVAWAGPGRVRVRAPAAFAEETLFISVYRRDLLQADGKTFLSSVATVAMVEPRPEVVVIPEELVGLPVAYDLDQATVLARLALFPLEDLRRALDLEGSDGVITYPALVRIDEGRGITAERLRGQLIVGEGEASVLMGRVREVVARRLDVLLLAVEPLLPWEVYARYQEELDLGALARQGVIPLDLGRAFGDGAGAATSQGLRPQSDSQDRRCEWSTPEVEANLSGELTNLPNLWLQAGVKLGVECKYANDKVVFSPSLTLTLGAGRFVFSPERFAAESAVGLGGEVKLALKGSVDAQGMGSGFRWLFNGAIPLFIGGAFEVYLEYGIPAFSLLRIMPDSGNMPQADLVALGARATGSLFLRYDTSQSPALRATPSVDSQVFLETPFQQLAFDPATRSLNLTLNGDLFAFGPTLGVGGTALKALKPLLALVGILTGRDIRLGQDSLIGLAIHLHPLSTELGYRYVFLSGALGGAGEPGSLQSSAALKAKVAVRSPILQYLAQRNRLIASILAGVDLTVLRYTRLEGDHRVLPGRLEVLPGGGQVRLRGEYLVRGGAEANEVRAYRLGDRSLLATATLRGSDRQFELQVPVPGNCEVLPQEERTAVVVLHARLAGLLVPLGWTHLGQVDLCSPIALEVPALRAFVGETAQGQGTARNGGEREVTLGLAAEVVGVSPASLSLPAGGSAPFSVSYRCTEEGSFVGSVAAQVEGRTVAPVPAVVTCIPDDDNNPGNNPSPDRAVNRVVRFFGDPHLITPDGAAYDFHATGEFWAVEHPAMPLQLRFLPMPENPQATYTARLAARLGQARVEVRPLSPGEWWQEGSFFPEVALAVLVEGEDRTADLAGGDTWSSPGTGTWP
jgi:hypothetical protein